MSTRYAWMTPPTWDKTVAEKDFEDIKKSVFGGVDGCTELQLVNFGKMWCVVFLTRESSSQDPWSSFYSHNVLELVYITDEGTGGYLK